MDGERKVDGKCVIDGCGNKAVLIYQSVGVCSIHEDWIIDGYTIEVIDGKHVLIDLEDIDYPNGVTSNAPYMLPVAPATEPPAPTGEDGDDDVPFELGIHRMIPGLWRLTHRDGIASMELVCEEADDSGYTELIDTLSGRIKALERALEPFAAFGSEILTSTRYHANFAEGDDSITHGINDVVVTLADWRRAHDALPAADAPEGGG